MTVKDDLGKILEQLDKTKAETDRLHGMINDFYCITLYQKYDRGDNVTFEDLENTEPDVYYPLPSNNGGKIKTKKIVTADNNLMYRTIFGPMATLKRHYHSNCDELIEVVSGVFTAITGRKRDGDFKTFTLNEGETMLIKEKLEHQVTNKSIKPSLSKSAQTALSELPP